MRNSNRQPGDQKKTATGVVDKDADKQRSQKECCPVDGGVGEGVWHCCDSI